MDQGPGLHNRRPYITSKICSLFTSFPQQLPEYDGIASKTEFWIEYVIREGFMTVDELAEGVSSVAWEALNYTSATRFLKEFRDAPHRSEQARPFVDKLCEYILRWFAIASVENLSTYRSYNPNAVARGGGEGFIHAASFIGHLIEWGLLSHHLVQRHLIKPLIAHNQSNINDFGVGAIYQLFAVAGNTLLCGLLEPEDVQTCLNALNLQILARIIAGFDAAKIKEFREIHAAWLEQKEKEEQRDAAETEECKGEEEDMLATEAPAEIKTPVAFVPQDLPTAAVDTDILFSISHNVESSSDTFVNIPSTTLSSPTLSISTISDLTPTELGEETEHCGEQMTARHKTLYFEDGNVEIVCGDTVFRIHSTIISFSSSKLRDILSPSTLLNAPTPGGCPRVVFKDSAEDFAVLLKMIYIPGFPARNKVPEFTVFASLLCMATKYGFSDVREQLIEDLKGAYPTKWEDFESAKVLGEDVFGSPKPHPNTVLNLFLDQNIKFASPFAAYRASLGGFPALVSDKPGTILPRLTLASTIHGRGEIRRMMTKAAYVIVYKEKLRSVCADEACVLKANITPLEGRIEALKKLHDAIVDERKGGLLSTPPLRDLTCRKCAKEIEAPHVAWRRACWELLPVLFSVAKGWDEV